MVVRACSLCGEVLNDVCPPAGRRRWECSSCRHQIAHDPCPRCGSVLTKDVIVPPGVEPGPEGLAIEQCRIAWHCARCAFVEDAPEGA